MDELAAKANGDAWLVQRGRYLDTTLLVEIGSRQWLVRIAEGRIARVEAGPFVMARWQFALRFDEQAWGKFCEPLPKPGFHDLMAMVRYRTLRVEGDQQPFMANLLYFKDLFAKLRGAA